MNASYPQFEYSFWDSLSPMPRAITRLLGYSFLGFCLLALYLGLRSDGWAGFVNVLLSIIPFLMVPLLFKCFGLAQTHYIAEPNQLISYQSLFGLRFNRKVYDVTTIRQWTLKVSYNMSFSFKARSKNLADKPSRNFGINIADAHGEREMVQKMNRELMQELFSFLRKTYPQASFLNRLVEQDELELATIEKREVRKFLSIFGGFGVFFLLLALWLFGSDLKQDWQLYQDSQAYAGWVPVERSIISQERRTDADDTLYYQVRFGYSYAGESCEMSENFSRATRLSDGDFEPIIFCDPKQPKLYVLTKQSPGDFILRFAEQMALLIALVLLLRALFRMWRGR